jgi:hypothetical protein
MAKQRRTFVYAPSMSLQDRVAWAESERDRAIERESRRACTAAMLDELIREALEEVERIVSLKTCPEVLRRRLRGMARRTLRELHGAIADDPSSRVATAESPRQ